MAREKASRKYQLTINNPLKHGLSHEQIKSNLSELKLTYWCMCDEIGLEEKTPHTHLYIVAKNAIMFSTMQTRFYGAHIESANGTSQQNRDYIRKEGDYTDSEKKETNLPETFEEYGIMPIERTGASSFSEELYQLIKDGCDNFTILERFPSAMNKLPQIERVRQELQNKKYADCFRKLEILYICGKTGVGKTRSVMEQYGYTNVYRIPNYAHPFDGYNGEDVILFDEFRSSLPISEMLQYLDGYPVRLPCRYQDKMACFTKVYIVSNISLEEQYPHVQYNEPETWKSFLRRISTVEIM